MVGRREGFGQPRSRLICFFNASPILKLSRNRVEKLNERLNVKGSFGRSAKGGYILGIGENGMKWRGMGVMIGVD